MLDSGLSWDKITKMINDSKNNGDYLANLIYDIKWVSKINFNSIIKLF